MAKKVIIKTTCPCCGYVHEVEETYVKKHCAPVGAKKEKSVEIPGFLNRYLTGTKYGNYNRTIICDALEEEGMYLEKEIFSGSVTIKGKEKFDTLKA